MANYCVACEYADPKCVYLRTDDHCDQCNAGDLKVPRVTYTQPKPVYHKETTHGKTKT